MTALTILRRHVVTTVAILVCSLVLGVWTGAVFAEPHFAIEETNDSLAHSWVLSAAGVAPYTAPTEGELRALDAAENALIEPPEILIRNADHGYTQCIEKIEAARALSGAVPMIVGHELVLYNETRAARVFVNADGIVVPIAVGGLEVEPDNLTGLSGAGEYAAAEIARSAMCLHSQLDPASPYCDMHAMVAGYGVGFANEEGTHLLFRVGTDDTVSCPEW